MPVPGGSRAGGRLRVHLHFHEVTAADVAAVVAGVHRAVSRVPARSPGEVRGRPCVGRPGLVWSGSGALLIFTR